MTADQKRTRKRTELPTSIYISEDESVHIDNLDLQELVEHSRRISDNLGNVSRWELEKRALRKAIIAKA